MELFSQQDSRKITELLCRYRANKALPAESWYAAAPISEIIEKDCILNPNLYMPPEKLPVRVRLSDGGRRSYDLRAGDILLNRASETLAELACCCAVLKDCSAVYGAFLKRLRPHGTVQIDPRYAVAYFSSRLYRQEVRRISVVYTTLANMNLWQLSMIRIYVPGEIWQKAFGQTLEDVIRFGQEKHNQDLDAVIDRFVDAFFEKFITYPIALFQKEREQG